MADYYSLLSRAVAALPNSAPESRQAVYERARKALFNQLRSIQPPVADSDIEAEGRSLDEAIARLELEAVRTAGAPTPRPPPVMPAAGPTPEAPEAEAPPQGVPPPAAAGGAPENAVEERPGAEALGDDAEPLSQPQRPAAPLPSLPEPVGNSRRVLVIAGVLGAVVLLVAALAYFLRESPDDLAKLTPESPGSAETGEGGKIADRVGDAAEEKASGAREPESAGLAVPVAQKAELWVAAPDEAAKVRTYPGTVVWRLDSLASGPGQPVTPAIRGDIDIPDAGLKASLLIQKNLDPTLSASHTVNISFQLEPGSDLQGVKAIGPLQMRRPEAQSGEQVAGVPVPITDNNFLIGLLRGSREARNLTLLRSPMVVDLPMQLDDGRAATISLEKGPAGERVFVDALDAWARK